MMGNKTIRIWRMGLVWACLWALGAAACSSATSDVHHITASQAGKLIERHANDTHFVILDVRTPREYEFGHIAQAVLLDFHNPAFMNRLKKLDRSKTYLIYCQTGYRSSKTLQMIDQMGFSSVYHLQRGVVEWYRHKLPLVRS